LARLKELEARFLHRPRLPGASGSLLRAAQVAALAARRYLADAGDRAAALAFATLLSMLPLLLIMLAALGAVGFSPATLERVRAWLLAAFLPDVASSLQASLEESVATLADASRALGLGGVLLLLLAGSTLLRSLDRLFRRIWGTSGLGPRLGHMAGSWATVLLGPILVASSLYLPALLEPVPGATALTSRLVGLATGFGAVLLAYLFLPGRRTSVAAAALGTTAAILLWECLRRGFAAYVRHAFVASTVLAGLGILPVFLLWLYFSWAAFILGAELGYVAQAYDEALARSGIARPAAG
jgi:membrane protein